MSHIGKKEAIALAILATAVGTLTPILLLRPAPGVAEPLQLSKEAEGRQKLQVALRDASLLDLIQNARVAARKGDSKTHLALVSGLRREPQRARTLIQSEIMKSTDSNDISILNRMITELP